MTAEARPGRRGDAVELVPMARELTDRMERFQKASASAELQNGMIGAFRHFARDHRISEDEARILLMDTGVRL
jgi:hypothetical protein